MSVTVEHMLKRGLLMPHPIPVPLRQVVQQRSEQGESVAMIARTLGLVPRTVRHFGVTQVEQRPARWMRFKGVAHLELGD